MIFITYYGLLTIEKNVVNNKRDIFATTFSAFPRYSLLQLFAKKVKAEFLRFKHMIEPMQQQNSFEPVQVFAQSVQVF